MQPQNSSFSHNGRLAWGIDFNQGPGVNDEDNLAFGRNLYSPVDGRVKEVRIGLPDFQNNSSFSSDNNGGFGNTIVIEDEGGDYYVRLAHMRYGSNNHLYVGKQLKMGDYIGQVGNTGFSTGPHLHIQVMKKTQEWDDGAIVNEATSPFTFVEGALGYDDWIKSGMTRNISMIDNNNEQNLSSIFEYAYRWYYPRYWEPMWHKAGAAGTGYVRHKVMSSWDTTNFHWRFRVKESGVYVVGVTFPTDANQDPRAEYSIDGKVVSHRDQTRATSTYKFIAFQYLAAGVMHTVTVQGTTPGTYVVADSAMVRKIY